MPVKPKRRGFALEMRTFEGSSGQTYIVFRTAQGAFHVLQEVEAKEAARHCGEGAEGTTRQMWQRVWDSV